MLLRMLGSIKRWTASEHHINRLDPTLWGDAVTDLKTSCDTLSTWIANNEDEMNTAFVALALGKDEPSKISYVKIDEQDLAGMEIAIATNDGSARGLDEKLLKNHRDLIDMDRSHINALAEYILSLMPNKERCNTYPRDKVIKLLNQYKKANKIKVEEMNPKLKDKLNW